MLRIILIIIFSVIGGFIGAFGSSNDKQWKRISITLIIMLNAYRL